MSPLLILVPQGRIELNDKVERKLLVEHTKATPTNRDSLWTLLAEAAYVLRQ